MHQNNICERSSNIEIINFEQVFTCQKFFVASTAQTIKLPIKDFFSKCDQIFKGKLHYLCSVALPDFSMKMGCVGDFEQVFTKHIRTT